MKVDNTSNATDLPNNPERMRPVSRATRKDERSTSVRMPGGDLDTDARCERHRRRQAHNAHTVKEEEMCRILAN